MESSDDDETLVLSLTKKLVKGRTYVRASREKACVQKCTHNTKTATTTTATAATILPLSSPSIESTDGTRATWLHRFLRIKPTAKGTLNQLPKPFIR